MALREAPNAQKRLDEILAGLGNSNPAFIAGFNPDYVNQVNQLYQGLTGALSGLDVEETLGRTSNERNLADLAAQRAKAQAALLNRLATRGTLASSIRTDEEAALKSQYDTMESDLGSNFNALLNSIGQRRNQYGRDYDINLGNLDLGVANQGAEYVKTKSDEEIRRGLAEQKALGTNQLADIGAGNMNRQITASAPPPLDLSALTAAYLAARPVAPTAPAPVAPVNPYKTAANPYLANPFGSNPTNPPKTTVKKPLTPLKGKY